MRLPLFMLLLCGCTTDATPTWATQSLWIGPAGEAQITGFQTWSVYGPGFERQGRPRHFICSMVNQLTLREVSCEEHSTCWQVDAEPIDTDCDGVSVPLELSLNAIALGAVSDELAGQDPYPLADAGSYVQLDGGPWIAHGWAFPGEATDSSVPVFQFDEVGQMTAWPAWSYPLLP